MCKQNIESAAKKAGASEAIWSEESKILVISFDSTVTSEDAIQKKVALAGYDTEKYAGDNKAYKKLHKCCQYENKRKSN